MVMRLGICGSLPRPPRTTGPGRHTRPAPVSRGRCGCTTGLGAPEPVLLFGSERPASVVDPVHLDDGAEAYTSAGPAGPTPGRPGSAVGSRRWLLGPGRAQQLVHGHRAAASPLLGHPSRSLDGPLHRPPRSRQVQVPAMGGRQCRRPAPGRGVRVRLDVRLDDANTLGHPADDQVALTDRELADQRYRSARTGLSPPYRLARIV
jgi:hypothetical protein